MRTGLVVMLIVLISSLLCQLFQSPLVSPTPTLTAIVEPPNPIKIDIVDVTMIYYEINGLTANDLRKAMNRLGPLDPVDGLHYDARTDWHISWSWPGYGESECDLSRVRVNYDIKVTVPFWNPTVYIDPALVDRWNHYMTALELHEQAAQEAIEEIRSLQAKYDQQTRHGNLQGALFP